MRYEFTFTVFTPTHNRADTLERPYRGLCAQTFRDFEWVIVDDGSTDGTEDLVARWQREADFPIRYVRQDHAGKCAAYNRAVAEARGRLFAPIDSDDEFLPRALEVFKAAWDSIPESERSRFSAVSGHCEDERGRLVGSRYPFDPTDSDSLEIRHRYGVVGEKCGFQRTDVLREFPYKIFPGETVIADSLIYNRIALKYKTRFVNEVVRKYYDTPGGWTATSAKIRARNSRGSRYYYQELIGLPYPFPLRSKLRGYANYVRSSFHGKVGVAEQVRGAPSFWLWLISLPLGAAAYWNDRCNLATE